MYKTLLAVAFIFFGLLVSTQSYAAQCWKEIEGNENGGYGIITFEVVSQSCSETPEGYVWIEQYEIQDFSDDGIPDYHLAIRPSFLDGWSTPILIYHGENAGSPIFALDICLCGGSWTIDTTTEVPEASTTYVTNWLDRDNVSGSGDWEVRSLFSSSSVCEFPSAIEARVINTSTIYTPGDNTPDVLNRFDRQY